MSDETESASPGEPNPGSPDEADSEPSPTETNPEAPDETGTAETTEATTPPADVPPAEAGAGTSSGGLDLRVVGRGVLGFLVAVTYTVVAAVASLVPPVPIAGATLNVAAWTGLVVVGLVAAAWLGFDVSVGPLSVRRLATFVGTAWVLLLPLGAVVEGVVAPLLGAGLVGIYLGRIVVFVFASVGALWMAYGGGWDRARARMGSGGLDKM